MGFDKTGFLGSLFSVEQVLALIEISGGLDVAVGTIWVFEELANEKTP